jgi:hypothetical protein
MKDVHAVLFQKEQEVERVGKEIRALLATIALLAEDQSTNDPVRPQPQARCRTLVDAREPEKAELELYYPFARDAAERE